MTLTPRRVPLNFLAAPIGGEVRGDGETAVSDVVLDSRRVRPGALFCCVPGARVDGHELAGAALQAGAAALLVQRPLAHDAPQLQRLLAEMVAGGVQAAAMEVSSHGLALGRVDATRFRAAVFTNLTQDHLDFHRDLEDYFQAKRRLLTAEFTGLGVVNVDDPYGRRLAAEARAGAGVEVVTTGTGPEADWRARDVRAALDGTAFRVQGPAGERELRLRLAGRFNVANALGALGAAGGDRRPDRRGRAPKRRARPLPRRGGPPRRHPRGPGPGPPRRRRDHRRQGPRAGPGGRRRGRRRAARRRPGGGGHRAGRGLPRGGAREPVRRPARQPHRR